MAKELYNREQMLLTALVNLTRWAVGPTKTGNPYSYAPVTEAFLTVGAMTGQGALPWNEIGLHDHLHHHNEEVSR